MQAYARTIRSLADDYACDGISRHLMSIVIDYRSRTSIEKMVEMACAAAVEANGGIIDLAYAGIDRDAAR